MVRVFEACRFSLRRFAFSAITINCSQATLVGNCLLCQVDIWNPERGSRFPTGLPPGRHMILFVRPAGRQHRPRGPHHPVRQRHRRHVPVTPLQQALQPLASTIRLLFPGKLGDHHPRSVDHQATQIPVAPFRYSQQTVLPSRRVLFRHQAEQMLNSTFDRRCCTLNYVAYGIDSSDFAEAGPSFDHIIFRLALDRA